MDKQTQAKWLYLFIIFSLIYMLLPSSLQNILEIAIGAGLTIMIFLGAWLVKKENDAIGK